MTTVTITMKYETCIECGVVFGIEKEYHYQLKKTHKSFCCPNGHSQYYPQETKEELLKKRLKWAQDEATYERERRTEAEYSARAHKAAHTRTKNRIKKGVCPFCNRHFDNLEAHMHSKHEEEA